MISKAISTSISYNKFALIEEGKLDIVNTVVVMETTQEASLISIELPVATTVAVALGE